MVRVAFMLSPSASGGFTARQRIPKDCQDAYEKLYGVRCEERWNSHGAMESGPALSLSEPAGALGRE